MLEQYVKDERELLQYMSYIQIGVAILVVVLLQLLNSPYGRYASTSWGPPVPGKVAWFVQELPSFAIPIWIVLTRKDSKMDNWTNCVLSGMYLLHYFQRTFIFPFLLRGGKPTPMIPFLLAVLFCGYNGYLQGSYLVSVEGYANNWLEETSVRLGIALFLIGMVINIHSDHILRNLRKPGETGYKIPTGGMFEYVSGANFLGEILEWFGYFVACQSLPAFAFFFFTASNIGPRAFGHHQWYRNKFKEDYPQNRKALIPFLL